MKDKKGTIISFDLFPISSLRKQFANITDIKSREVSRETSLTIANLYELVNGVWNEIRQYIKYVKNTGMVYRCANLLGMIIIRNSGGTINLFLKRSYNVPSVS
jgi:hypothetical protein